jgi:hypothetical protein
MCRSLGCACVSVTCENSLEFCVCEVIYLCTHCSHSVVLHPAEFFAASRSSMLLWVELVLLFTVCFCHYLLFNSCITSNIGLWGSMYVSFICSLSLLILHIWYFSHVFRCFPFFSVFKIFVESAILPYVCLVFNIWFEYHELPLLLIIACICSLYLVLNVQPVCPMYFNGKSIHLTWYTPLCSHLSRCRRGFIRFSTVFLVWNGILIFASLKSSVISFVSFP